MEDIDFNTLQERVISILNGLFDIITSLPEEARNDSQERTGITLFIGRENGNSGIYYSSFKRKDIVEDILLTKKVTVSFENGKKYYCSVYGLKEEENIFIAIVLLSYSLKRPIKGFIIKNIQDNGGYIPNCFFEDGHYLKKLMA